jgi:hypothetical protein
LEEWVVPGWLWGLVGDVVVLEGLVVWLVYELVKLLDLELEGSVHCLVVLVGFEGGCLVEGFPKCETTDLL